MLWKIYRRELKNVPPTKSVYEFDEFISMRVQ